jgi:tetratricopeptide (TPR) repeat protein
MTSVTHIFSGDFQSMKKSGKKAIEVSEDPLYSIFGKFGFGVGCFLCGQFKEAEDVLQSMVDFSEKRGEGQCLIWAYLFLGPALIANGRMDQGLKVLKKGQQAIVENQRKGLEAVSEYVLGKIYSQIATGPKPSLSIMVKNLGFLVKNVPFASQKAIKHFSRVISVSEEIGAKGAIGPAYLELGLLYKAKGRSVKAREFIFQAIQDFEQCKAETYLKEAKEALASL